MCSTHDHAKVPEQECCGRCRHDRHRDEAGRRPSAFGVQIAAPQERERESIDARDDMSWPG